MLRKPVRKFPLLLIWKISSIVNKAYNGENGFTLPFPENFIRNYYFCFSIKLNRKKDTYLLSRAYFYFYFLILVWLGPVYCRCGGSSDFLNTLRRLKIYDWLRCLDRLLDFSKLNHLNRNHLNRRSRQGGTKSNFQSPFKVFTLYFFEQNTGFQPRNLLTYLMGIKPRLW